METDKREIRILQVLIGLSLIYTTGVLFFLKLYFWASALILLAILIPIFIKSAYEDKTIESPTLEEHEQPSNS